MASSQRCVRERRSVADADDGARAIIFVACAVAGLSFGVAEGGPTFGLAASWHGLFSVTVTQSKGMDAGHVAARNR